MFSNFLHLTLKIDNSSSLKIDSRKEVFPSRWENYFEIRNLLLFRTETLVDYLEGDSHSAMSFVVGKFF